MTKHGDSTLGNNHVIENWQYASAAARTGASGFVAGDVGKIAYQTDEGSWWRLTATTPTWERVGGSAGVTVDFTIGAEAGNVIQVSGQVKDANGDNAAGIYWFVVWLADNNTNLEKTTNIPDNGVIISTGKELFDFEIPVWSTDVMWILVTDNTGLFVLDIEVTFAVTYYACVGLPDGTTAVSSAVTFT